MWRFSPSRLDKNNERVSLVAYAEANKAETRVFSLRLLGSCTAGSLQAAELYKDFGSVIVGNSVSTELLIINNNDCALHFQLYVKQICTDEVSSASYVSVFNTLTTDSTHSSTSLRATSNRQQQKLQQQQLQISPGNATAGTTAPGSGNDFCMLELETYKTRVEARSTINIRCRLRPVRLINYQFIIEYRLIYDKQLGDDDEDNGGGGVNGDEMDNLGEEEETNGLDGGNGVESHLTKVMRKSDRRDILCYLTANGVYPKLKVIDIKGLGSSSSLSKDYMWKLLGINE